jgi:hypothetical protein
MSLCKRCVYMLILSTSLVFWSFALVLYPDCQWSKRYVTFDALLLLASLLHCSFPLEEFLVGVWCTKVTMAFVDVIGSLNSDSWLKECEALAPHVVLQVVDMYSILIFICMFRPAQQEREPQPFLRMEEGAAPE